MKPMVKIYLDKGIDDGTINVPEYFRENQATEEVMNWQPIKDVPENTPVQVLYFDIIDNNETPLLALALKRNGNWFCFRGHDNAWDETDYTETWNINFPVQWQPIAELPTASNNGFNLTQAKAFNTLLRGDK